MKKKYTYLLIPVVMVIIVLSLGIGYAIVSPIEMNINGTLIAQAQQEIFITDIEYGSDVEADKTSSNISKFYQNIMESKNVLSSTNSDSSITWNITIYNSTNATYEFKEVIYSDSYYDNSGIIFELTNLKEKDQIAPKESLTFSITFKYGEGADISKNTLSSVLKFDFQIPEEESTYAGIKFDEDTVITTISDNVQITIPAGMTVSKLTGEYESAENGIVLYRIPDSVAVKSEVDSWSEEKWIEEKETMQTTYDQFVWVPVDTPVLDLSSDTSLTEDTIKSAVQEQINNGKYPMAIKNSSSNYIGVLYAFTGDTNGVTISVLSSWTPLSSSGNREPSAISNGDTYTTILSSGNLNKVNKILGTSYKSSTDFGTALQTNFNEMVKRISTNKGFWVARYETTNINESTKTKVNSVKGSTDGLTGKYYHYMYAQQNIYWEMAELTTVKSDMIFGCQWDQIMIWMKDVPNATDYAGDTPFYIVNSKGMGNYETANGGTGSVQNTGYYEVKNIYDLSGNVNEYTMEAYGSTQRKARGGSSVNVTSFNSDSSPYASYRTNSGYGIITANVGSRFTIF